jgi:iron-sulfur cluster repair protein YtfE (RIC family)
MENRISGREIAWIAGGVAFGIIASRLLPPMIATGSGAIRARMGEDAFELLVQDHRQILDTLHKMEHVDTYSNATRAGLFLKLKRTLAKHALAEEDVVYPLLTNEENELADSRHLYDEHADMKIALYELEALLKAGADWRTQVRELRTEIEQHVRDEENIVFPKLRQRLDDRKQMALSGQIRREEAMVL